MGQDVWDPQAWPRFILMRGFDRRWTEFGLGDAELQRLQNAILASPQSGDVVKGGGSLRKIRFAKSGRGKSGSHRVFYADSRISESSS